VTRAFLTVVVTLGGARVAEACATCIASPFGDRTYNWAYLGLIATPFVLGGAIAVVLTGCWLAARRERPERRGAPAPETVSDVPIIRERREAHPPERRGAPAPERREAHPPERREAHPPEGRGAPAPEETT